MVGGRDKMIHAIDASSGKAAWTFATRARVDSSPAVAGGRVYIGSSDGRLYVLDLATGQKQWEFDAGAAITASPAIAGGRVVVGSQDGVIYCLRLAATKAPSHRRTGVVAIVVTSAISTIIVNSVGEMTPEIQADVQHDQLHQAARVHQHAQPGGVAPARARWPRPASSVPPNLPTVATTMISPQTSHSYQPDTQADLGPHAGERKERRQQQDRHEVFQTAA